MRRSAQAPGAAQAIQRLLVLNLPVLRALLKILDALADLLVEGVCRDHAPSQDRRYRRAQLVIFREDLLDVPRVKERLDDLIGEV